MSSDRVTTRLQDIVDNADWIAEYLGDYDLERFRRDRKTADAVERCLARISEAIVQIGPEEATRVGIVLPWHDVRSLGNRLRHEYRRINRSMIFETARNDIPALRQTALKALEN
ncbi:hypothetical protein SR41_06120 [Sphingomonas melonis]|uniref:DUF86 domain-containing protein n=1 Tax=Sphingomonas melonis TaxID=152682 RepID=A0A0D1M9S2_9SPHN|nr:HepT-like ribonuclease domain-containing protein [Sphingomonas melonis]KIU29045.1 hypothetical protein SR41_06120 [Sphingomonas melonis]